MGKIYAIDGSEKLTSADFISKYTKILENILEDPGAKILLSDFSGCGIYTARFLKQVGYRSAVLYHLGETPRINIASLTSLKSFKSKEELRYSLREDSDIYIYF